MGRMVYELFHNLTGESRAIDESLRSSRNGVNTLYTMVNFEPSQKAGEITRSKGFVEKLSLGAIKPVQNIEFVKDSKGDTHLLAVQDSKLFEVKDWNGKISSTKVYSGLGTGYVDICPALNIIALFDGDYPKQYDFSSVTQLTDHHKVSFGIYKNDRLWTNNVAEPHQVHWSSAGDIDDFATLDNAGFLPIGYKYRPITSMADLFVPADNSSHIIIAKEDEIHAISGNSGASTDSERFRSYFIAKGIGTTSIRGLMQVGQEVFVLSKDDIRPYSSLVKDTGVIDSYDLALPIRSIYRDRVRTEYLENGYLFYAPNEGRDGRIYAFVPTTQQGYPDTAHVYDKIGGWFRRQFLGFAFTCMAQDPDTGTIWAGDINGKLYEFNTGLSYAGFGYKSFIDTGFSDLKLPQNTKCGTPNNYIEVEASQNTKAKLTVLRKNKNGTIGQITNRTIPINNTNAVFTLSKHNESVYTDGFSKKENFETGVYTEVSVQFEFHDKDVDVKIKKIYLEAEAKGEI